MRKILVNMIQIGDNVCFGERLGDFGKIQHKVIGIEKELTVFISEQLIVVIMPQ